MPIEVTDEMVQAARRKMPARWSMQDLHDAIEAAIEAAPPLELRFRNAPSELTEQERAEWDRMLADAAAAPMVRVLPPSIELRGEHGPELPLIDSCTPSELRTGGLIYAGPLGGITEIAAHLGVARSTVVGWTKRAEKIGMPAPLAELAAGPVYSLDAVETWYHTWKQGADADAAA